MKEKCIVIVDMDGTLALTDQRQHWFDWDLHPELNNNQRWDAFLKDCDKDEPNPDIVQLVKDLDEMGYIINIFCTRRILVKEKTEKWLEDNGILYTDLIFRENDDPRKEDDLKRAWMSRYKREQIYLIIDDRLDSCMMWRDLGFTCLQVAKGAF